MPGALALPLEAYCRWMIRSDYPEDWVREMFWFKGCPKCHGDLYSDTDVYGSYVACIQCSHYLTEAEEARLVSSEAQLEHADTASLVLERVAA